MKLVLFTLLAFAGSFAHADDDDNPMGPNSYAGLMARLHGYVNRARDVVISDLNKSSLARDFDEALQKKILLDEKRFNHAIWHLNNPEDPSSPGLIPKNH
jgi:hypothetical protein